MQRPRIPLLNLAVAVALACAGVARADEQSDVDRLFSTGQWAEAVQKADQFLAGHPRDARMRFLKGLALSEMGKSTEAVAVFVKLTEDFPELPEPYNNLAVLYSKQGQYDQARKALEAAIRTNPSYATAYENLGDVYAKLASQAYSKALQMDTGSNAKVGPKLAMIRDLFTPKAIVMASNSAKPVATRPAPAAAPAPVPATPPAPPATPPSPATAPKPPVLTAQAPAPKPAQAPAPKAVPAPGPASQAAAPTASAKASTPPATADSSAAQDARAAVLAWAQAWSRKDVDAYLAAYTPGYSAGKSRKAWEEERRARIVGKRSISVNLSDIEARVQGDKATVVFRQHYSADALKVSSRKTLELVKMSGRWLIQKESTGS